MPAAFAILSRKVAKLSIVIDVFCRVSVRGGGGKGVVTLIYSSKIVYFCAYLCESTYSWLLTSW
jgi:hypothetical protein